MKRYAISSWIVEDTPTDDAIALLADHGFESVELSGGVSPLLMDWESDPAGVCGKLERAGLAAPSVHGPRPGRELDAEDEAQRLASVAANVQYFERMRDSGIPEVVIHPTSGVDVSTPGRQAAARERSVDSLKRLADRAAEFGVRLAVENLSRAPRPASSMADLIDMTAGLGEHVGLCHDVGHTVQAGLDPFDEMCRALATDRLFSLHLHDVKPDGVDHYKPGEGGVALDRLIAHLDTQNFAGLRTLEIKPPEENVQARVAEVAAVKEHWLAL